MKRIRKLTTAFLVIALLVTSLVSVPALAEDDDYVKVTRLAGASRYLTAVEVSKEAYEEADTVIIAAGADKNFPDALAASALAGKLDAPILLAEQDGFRAGTLEEIERLGAEKAIVLGGEKALGAEVVAALEDADLEVERIAGENRYETAALIAEEVLGTGKEVFLVNGDEPWDALAIGPVAAEREIPVLLTKAGALRAETKAFLVDNGITRVTILGGVKAVSEAAKNEIPAGISVKRIWGDNREATAIQIANNYFPEATEVVVASRDKFADALVGGYFGGLNSAPVLLVYEKAIRENTDKFLFGLNPETIYVLGGTSVVSKAVADELDGYGVVKSVKPIAGQKIQPGENLEFLVNGKWTVDYEAFDHTIDSTNYVGKNFPGYSVKFFYTGSGSTLANDLGKTSATATGTGKYAVEVSYQVGTTTVVIPAGGVLAKDFVKFDVVDLTAFAKVTKHQLVNSGDVAVKEVAWNDTVTGYKVKVTGATNVGGKPFDVTGITFVKWIASDKPTVIEVGSSGDLVLKSLGNAKLTYQFKIGATEYKNDIVVTVKQERKAASIAEPNRNVKVFTYASKTFNFGTDEGLKVVVLDQYGAAVPDATPHLVLKKGSVVLSQGPASALNTVDLPAGNYSVEVYEDATRAKLYGAYTITSYEKTSRYNPTFELVFVDPLDPINDPLGPRKTELDLNLLLGTPPGADTLSIAIKAYYRGAPLTSTDLGQFDAFYSAYELRSSKSKVVSFGLTEVDVITKDESDLDTPFDIYSGVDLGESVLTLLTVDGGSKDVVFTLVVKAVDTTPKINTLQLQETKVLNVKIVGTEWILNDYEELYSPDLAPFFAPGVTNQNMVDKIESVIFYGDDIPAKAEVTMKEAFGGKTFTFNAKLVPAT